MNDEKEEEILIEAAAGAFRATDASGGVRSHPAWHDLDDDGRVRSFELGTSLRRLEAALDPEGLSATARLVLERIRRG